MTVWLDELAECGATPQDIAVSVPTLADLAVDHQETGSAAG